MKTKLWLDDMRDPRQFGKPDWYWVKSAQEAIEQLKTGAVMEASLDHDLTDEQTGYGGAVGKVHDDGHESGYDVVLWLEQNPQYLPPLGCHVHSMNPAGRARMEQVLNRLYAAREEFLKELMA